MQSACSPCSSHICSCVAYEVMNTAEGVDQGSPSVRLMCMKYAIRNSIACTRCQHIVLQSTVSTTSIRVLESFECLRQLKVRKHRQHRVAGAHEIVHVCRAGTQAPAHVSPAFCGLDKESCCCLSCAVCAASSCWCAQALLTAVAIRVAALRRSPALLLGSFTWASSIELSCSRRCSTSSF